MPPDMRMEPALAFALTRLRHGQLIRRPVRQLPQIV